MQAKAYLDFNGRAEEAIEFYKRAVGAEVITFMRFKDGPKMGTSEGCQPPPGIDEKVMHACLKIGETEVMASDGRCTGAPNFEGFSLALTAGDTGEAERLFKALGEGGEIRMPMGETFFSPGFGMVADKFGVSWMVVTLPAEAKAAAE